MSLARLAARAPRFPFLPGLLRVEPLLFPLQFALLPERLALFAPVALVFALLLVEALSILRVPSLPLLEPSLRAIAEFLLPTQVVRSLLQILPAALLDALLLLPPQGFRLAPGLDLTQLLLT